MGSRPTGQVRVSSWWFDCTEPPGTTVSNAAISIHCDVGKQAFRAGSSEVHPVRPHRTSSNNIDEAYRADSTVFGVVHLVGSIGLNQSEVRTNYPMNSCQSSLQVSHCSPGYLCYTMVRLGSDEMNHSEHMSNSAAGLDTCVVLWYEQVRKS